MKTKAITTNYAEIHAAIYARVSTDEQAKSNDSISNQIKAAQALAEHFDMPPISDQCIIFDDTSGMTLNRPGLERLRQMIRTKQINAIIVRESSRLSRKPGDAELLFDEMLRYGCRFFVALHHREFDLSNSTDRFQLLIEMGFNRQWRDMAVRNMTDAKAAYAEWRVVGNGCAKFGYEKVRTDKRTLELRINEAEAKIVRDLYDWIDAGVSLRGIAAKLKDVPNAGIRKGNRPGAWHHSTIRNLVLDPSYCGQFRQKHKYYGETEPTEHIIPIPPIVSREQFDRVKERLAENKANPRKVTDHYLLLYRLRCQHCDRPISTFNPTSKSAKYGTKQYFYYLCKSKRPPYRGDCLMSDQFDADKLDAFVWRWVLEKLHDPEKLRAEIDAAQEGYHGRAVALYERLAGIETTREQHKGRLRELLGTTAQSASVRSMLDTLVKELDQIFTDLDNEQARLQREIAQMSDFYINLADVPSDPPEGIDPEDRSLDDVPMTLEQQRRLIERYNITGRLAVEGQQRVIYLSIGGGHTERQALGAEQTSRTSQQMQQSLLDVVMHRGCTFRLALTG